MDNNKKKELRKQYEQRHPDMGIICLAIDDRLWVDSSVDANADINGISFQLKLGSWPNKDLQKAYTQDSQKARFTLVRKLDYEDYQDDHTDDLKLMLMDFLEEHSDAMPLRGRFSL